MRHVQRAGAVICAPRSEVTARRLALLLLASAALSCSPRAGSAPVPAGTPATLRVDNQAFLDVNVYAVRSGQRIRVGSVTGLSTRTFVLPRTLVDTGAPVQFVADFVGSDRAPISERIVIWAGDEVELRIPAT